VVPWRFLLLRCATSPGVPVSTVACYLRFVYWNAHHNRLSPVPAGVKVRARERDLGVYDDVEAEAQTDDEGRVELQVRRGFEHQIDLYFELLFEGRKLDPVSNRLVTESPGAIDLDAVWSSEGAVTEDHLAGLVRDFGGQQIGTPAAPWTFRLWTDAWLRLCWWNPLRHAFMGLPEGTRVQAIDRHALGEVVLAEAKTGPDGCVHLNIPLQRAHRPDLAFRTAAPPEAPFADMASGAWTSVRDGAVGLPLLWESHAAFVLGDPTARGYWANFASATIGHADNPYVFDLLGEAPKARHGTLARPLIDGVQLWEAWRQLLEGARHSIHIEMMLYFDDAMGRRFTDLVLRKAAEGVDVRLMIDVNTSKTIHQLVVAEKLWAKLFQVLTPEEREARIAALEATDSHEAERGQIDDLLRRLGQAEHLSLIDTSFAKVAPIPQADGTDLPEAYAQLEAAVPFFSIARIDHRKMIIVDGKIGTIGGQNVGWEYIYETPFDPAVPAEDEAWERWHDCSIQLEGPAVEDLQRLFRERWVGEGGDAFDLGPRLAGRPSDPDHPCFPQLNPMACGVPVTILDTTPGARFAFHQDILARIAAASREILIESPYFASRETLAALVDAARRGVRVVFIFPDERNDSVDFLYAGRMVYERLIDAGVEVYEYPRHMNHSKVAIIDGVSQIGSANLNHSSYFHHYEVVAVVDDAGFTADFRRDQFEVDLALARRIRREDIPSLLNINALAKAYVSTVVMTRF
jgi:phosphatidylserine/phosphatidylglycerophosphate/cardiolipin synthase-like enzyme